MTGIPQKNIALFFITSMLLPVLYSVLLQAHQSVIRHKMKEKMEAALLVHMVLPVSELHWVKPGKEIFLNQQMFDVKTMNYGANGTVSISGLYDELETALMQHLKTKQQDEQSRGNAMLVQFFHSFETLPADLPEEFVPATYSVPGQISNSTGLLPSPFAAILTPPPQC